MIQWRSNASCRHANKDFFLSDTGALVKACEYEGVVARWRQFCMALHNMFCKKCFMPSRW